MATIDTLQAISPIDGRYHDKTADLTEYLSEGGLIRARVQVEAALLNALTSGVLPDVPDIGDEAHKRIDSLVDKFSLRDAQAIKDIEKVTNHDVKAVEIWMRQKLENDPTVSNLLELIHFGVTSEDINNNAWNLMHDGATQNVILPRLDAVIQDLGQKAEDYKDIPLLSLTHGQPATPTTLGKEMGVFATRLEKSASAISNIVLTGKLNGASGTYGAMTIAYPEVNWQAFAQKFVENLGFDFNPTTTQIEPHDTVSQLFKELSTANTKTIDLSRDMWGYISRHVFALKMKEGEVGSSTMPHKVNPIDFENSEANAGLSIALFDHLAGKLMISRFQRDLSDSAAFRGSATAFGHMAISLSALSRGLGKVTPDNVAIARELDDAWEILAEPIQTVGRRHKIPNVYDVIKHATRGKKLDMMGYLKIIDEVDLPDRVKDELRTLSPATYIGSAPQIAHDAYLRTASGDEDPENGA